MVDHNSLICDLRIYLDVCCLNRPFDDQRQDRIRLESEAIRIILKQVRLGEFEWISSSIVDYEISKTPDPERRNKVLLLTTGVSQKVKLDTSDASRVFQLEKMGFGAFDALHLICAEKAKVDVLLTTDVRFLKTGMKNVSDISVRLINPVTWLQEVMT